MGKIMERILGKTTAKPDEGAAAPAAKAETTAAPPATEKSTAAPTPAPAPAAQAAITAAPPADAKSAAAPAPTPPAVVEAADPGAVAQLCADAGVPQLAKALIDAKLPLAECKAKIDNAAEIHKLVATARRYLPTIGAGLADEFIRNGATAAEAGRALLAKMAANQSPEIRNAHTPGPRPAGAATDDGWDASIARVSGRRKA